MARRTRKTRCTPNYQTLENRRLLACDISGTAGDDFIDVQIGAASVVVRINGDINTCSPDENVNIDALGGNDFIRISDNLVDHRAELRPGSVLLQGRFDLNAINVESSQLNSGGGHDVAIVFDSTGDDTVFAQSTGLFMRGSGFQQRVNGYDQVFAISTEGADTAYFSGSDGNDVFVGDATNSRMNYSDSFIDVRMFSNVYANASFAGNDQAVFNGSAGNDIVYATDNFSTISSSEYRIRAAGFERVLANESAGYDTATAVDSILTDSFYGMPGFSNVAFGTNQVSVSLISFEDVSMMDALDQPRNNNAILFGGEGDDTFYGRLFASTLWGTGYQIRLEKFQTVKVEDNGGQNLAGFIDDRGDASFTGTSVRAILTGSDRTAEHYSIEARGFSKLNATSARRGDNGALLGRGKAGTNRFYGDPLVSWVRSETFEVNVFGFRRVSASATNQDSIAILVGSDDDDALVSNLRQVLRGVDNSYEISVNYGTVYIDGKGGHDVAEFEDLRFDDTFSFRNGSSFARLGGGDTVSANGFESINVSADANPNLDGFDTAFLFDTSGDDFLEASDGQVTLTGGGYVVNVEMDRVFARADQGGTNRAVITEPLLTELFLIGDWIE